MSSWPLASPVDAAIAIMDRGARVRSALRRFAQDADGWPPGLARQHMLDLESLRSLVGNRRLAAAAKHARAMAIRCKVRLEAFDRADVAQFAARNGAADKRHLEEALGAYLSIYRALRLQADAEGAG